MNCPKCQKPISEGVKFCGSCGSPMENAQTQPNSSAPITPVAATPQANEGKSTSVFKRFKEIWNPNFLYGAVFGDKLNYI